MKPPLTTWGGFKAPLPHSERDRVSIVDMVVHLGRVQRWAGYGVQEWTVLHHLMLVALLWIRAGFPLAEVVYALGHDWHEYVTGDLPSPIKDALRFFLPRGTVDPIKSLESYVDGHIFDSLGLLPPSPRVVERVKLCDSAALLIESVLFGPPDSATRIEFPPDYLAELQKLIRTAVPEFEQIVVNRAGAPQ